MKKKTRQGIHKDGKTLFGAYVEPEVKALAMLVSDRLGITFTDIILNGLNSEAVRAGVMKNGKLLPQYNDAFAVSLEYVKMKIEANKKTPKTGE